MGARLSTSATAASGTKAASQPVKRHRRLLRRLRCFTGVEESSVEVIEWFGRFHRIARPGFNWVWCCVGQGVAGRLSTQLQHQDVQAEVRTADGVFVELVFSVQYRVADDRQYEAFYSMAHPASQVTSYVLDAVGSAAAAMEVEQLFHSKSDLVAAVRCGLDSVLHTHGYAVQDCLITVLAPTATVKEAMSNVLAAQRQRVAAWEQGEADKLRLVKHAEGSAESKYLQGQGLARFLIAFTAGARDALKVVFTGRIQQKNLAFPQPPPADEQAALAAAAAPTTPPGPAAYRKQQEQRHLQEEAPAGRRQPGIAQQGPAGPVMHVDDRSGIGASPAQLPGRQEAVPAQQAKVTHVAKLADQISKPELLPPHAPGTPSRGTPVATVRAAAPQAARSPAVPMIGSDARSTQL